MVTPSEAYYSFGDAISLFLGVDFLVAHPKKGRKKGTATSMALSLPSVLPSETVRYGSGSSVNMELIVTAANKHDILLTLDAVVQWLKENRNTLNFELLLVEATPYYQGDEHSPELVGYFFDITTNL